MSERHHSGPNTPLPRRGVASEQAAGVRASSGQGPRDSVQEISPGDEAVR
jgi:hypothetical protein